MVVVPHPGMSRSVKKIKKKTTADYIPFAPSMGVGVNVPDDGAAGNCTGPGWSRGTGTALWSGSSLRCGPEEVSGQIRGG